MANSWETFNQSCSTSQRRIVPPGTLSGSTRHAKPSPPTVTAGHLPLQKASAKYMWCCRHYNTGHPPVHIMSPPPSSSTSLAPHSLRSWAKKDPPPLRDWRPSSSQDGWGPSLGKPLSNTISQPRYLLHGGPDCRRTQPRQKPTFRPPKWSAEGHRSQPSPLHLQRGSQQRRPPSPRRDVQEEQYRCRTCKRTGHSTNWEGCPSKQCPEDTRKQDSLRGYDLQLGQECLPQPNSSHLRGIAPPDPLSGMPDTQLLSVPLASTEQCHTPSSTGVEPPIKEDPVPGPNHEADPPPGDSGFRTALIIATGEPPTPETTSPNPSPEDEPLVDQTATPFLGDQELASSDAEVKIALAPVVAAAGVGSPPVASEVTPDFVPTSPSSLSPESVVSLPPGSDIDRPWRNPKKKKKGQKRAQ
ncbi:uncharacterized protein [Macrobrachium rosenbergii]|uniref:uncharacterized protein n=1 Tax=Macrobrachium rosenbergii TaxID=79674 RepID=UPI0034D49B5E